jgi:predicted transposase/invertase (TIGR01784 family)
MHVKNMILDTDDPVDIRKDNVFKMVFVKNAPESTGALSKLVSALISKDVTIVSILANEPVIDNLRDRQIRYDINCRAESGELINVEMCLDPKPYEPVRLEFHTAKLFTGQDIRGKDKNFSNLKRTYQIAILANEKFFPDKEFFHTFEYYDSIRKVSLNGRTQIITLELTKLDEVVDKPINEMNVSERWAVFFRYLTDRSKRSKINQILEIEEGIAMASQVLLKVSRDEEERAILMRNEKIELDYQSGLSYAKWEGHIEGVKERNEYVLQLIAQGLSPDEIKQRLTL